MFLYIQQAQFITVQFVLIFGALFERKQVKVNTGLDCSFAFAVSLSSDSVCLENISV